MAERYRIRVSPAWTNQAREGRHPMRTPASMQLPWARGIRTARRPRARRRPRGILAEFPCREPEIKRAELSRREGLGASGGARRRARNGSTNRSLLPMRPQLAPPRPNGEAPAHSRTGTPILTAHPKVRVFVIWLPERNPPRTPAGSKAHDEPRLLPHEGPLRPRRGTRLAQAAAPSSSTHPGSGPSWKTRIMPAGRSC
jgi:hypothetical protein